MVSTDAERELSGLSLMLAEHTAGSFESVDLVLQGLIERFRADGIDSPTAFRTKLGTAATRELLLARIADLPHDGRSSRQGAPPLRLDRPET
jgi:hypothetical protein